MDGLRENQKNTVLPKPNPWGGVERLQSQVSVPFANNKKAWYKSIVGRWPKIMESVAYLSQANLGAKWSILRDTDKAKACDQFHNFSSSFCY